MSGVGIEGNAICCRLFERLRPWKSGYAGHVLFRLCSGTVALVFAAVATATAQAPFERIELRLEDGILNRTLPFDVPYILFGAVPDTATVVTGAFAVQEQEGLAPVPNCSSRSDLPAVSEWRRPASAPDDTPLQFQLLMPPLDVNTLYCMRFGLARAFAFDEEPLLANRTATVIDEELRRLEYDQRNMGHTELEALRQRLIAAVLTGNAREEISASPGTIFDARDPELMARTYSNRANDAPPLSDATRSIQRLGEAILPVVNAHFQRNALLDSFEGRPSENETGRLIAETMSALRRVREYFAENAAVVVAIRAQLVDDGDAQAMLDRIVSGLGSATRELANIAGGLPPGSVGPSVSRLGAIWEVQSLNPCTVPEVAARVQALNSTAAFLSTLRDTIIPTLAATPDDEFVAAVNEARGSVDASRFLLSRVPQLLCDRQEAISAMTDGLIRVVREEVALVTTTSGTFAVRHPWYFGVDAGLAVAPMIGEVFPYVGANIYFRPVNKDALLSSLTNTGSRRVSLMVGYTWTDNLLKSGERSGLFAGNDTTFGKADGMMVVGIGGRVTDHLRATVGGLFFKAANPNPLIRDANLESTLFFSLSWDWDAVGTVRGLGGLLGFGDGPVALQPGSGQ